MNMHFDTLAAVKRIEAAGLDRAAAEAVVAEIAAAQIELADKQDVTLILRDAAATKTELEAAINSTRSELHAAINTTKAELRTEIAAAKNDMIRWLIGTQTFMIATLAALSKFTELF